MPHRRGEEQQTTARHANPIIAPALRPIATLLLHSLERLLYSIPMGNRNKSPDPDARHGGATDAEAFDLLAAWIRAGAPGARDVERAWSHADGTWELVLRHENGRARSVTQRSLSGAIRSALGVARTQGA